MNDFPDKEMMELLAGVSRSFVLTIRALPKGLRRPIGLAYLLARASDTIADTADAPVETRVACLRAFPAVAEMARKIEPANAMEYLLLRNLPRVTGALQALPEADREEVEELLKKITRGQELDLLRFPDPEKIHALDTAAQLDEYTYLVAGCVGEFWTRICGAHLPRYGRLPMDELSQLGRCFGQGLQLVNILRDFPEDIRNGRCYLPTVELKIAGITDPEELRIDLRSAGPVFEAWRLKALRYHEDARLYIEAIRPWRIRFACLIPWALGVRTLELMSEESPLEEGERIKVGRKEVGRIMRHAVWGALSNGVVKRWSPAA